MSEQLAMEFGKVDEFDGETFNHWLDSARLHGQLLRVFRVMRDGKWRSLARIQLECIAFRTKPGRDSEAAISARLRDLRKPKFGGHTVKRRRVPGENGLHEYQLVLRKGT